MRKFYKQTLQRALDNQIKDPFELSLALIVSSLPTVKYRSEFNKIKENFSHILAQQHLETGTTPKLAWLYGRLFYCSYITDSVDPSDIFMFSNIITDIQKSSFELNECTVWAFGYFSLDKIVYKNYIQSSGIYVDKLVSMSDKVWAEILHLQATSEHKNKEDFEVCRKRLIKSTGSENLLEALDKLPVHNYRLWGYGAVCESLLKIDKDKNFEEAKRLLEEMYRWSRESMNLNDIAIGQAFSERLKDIYSLE